MRSSSGLLLLLIAVLGLVGFLTGNLDRWLAYLFDPARPPLSGASSTPAPTGSAGLVSVASTTARRTA